MSRLGETDAVAVVLTSVSDPPVCLSLTGEDAEPERGELAGSRCARPALPTR